jgi:hypothetical protein
VYPASVQTWGLLLLFLSLLRLLWLLRFLLFLLLLIFLLLLLLLLLLGHRLSLIYEHVWGNQHPEGMSYFQSFYERALV